MFVYLKFYFNFYLKFYFQFYEYITLKNFYFLIYEYVTCTDKIFNFIFNLWTCNLHKQKNFYYNFYGCVAYYKFLFKILFFTL